MNVLVIGERASEEAEEIAPVPEPGVSEEGGEACKADAIREGKSGRKEHGGVFLVGGFVEEIVLHDEVDIVETAESIVGSVGRDRHEF